MTKAKNTIFILLTLVILSALMFLGTNYDMQISEKLTSFSGGKYYSDDHIANVLECVTEIPVFILLSIAVSVWGYSAFLKHKAYRIPFTGLFSIAVFVINYLAIQRALSRLSELYDFSDKLGTNLSIIAYSLISILLMLIYIVIGLKLGEEKLQKLIPLSVAIIWIIAITFILTQIFKIAFARPRFRTMYVISNFDEYIPWYKSGFLENYSKKYEGWTLPDDAFKSFPSGHTSFVSVLVVFVYLPKFFEKISLKAYVNILIVSYLYILLVAVSRIIAGAHFLTDVVMGYALCFVVTIITVPIVLKKKKTQVESVILED